MQVPACLLDHSSYESLKNQNGRQWLRNGQWGVEWGIPLRGHYCQLLLRDGLKKRKEKKLMEFSIKLAGWVLDAPVFH